MPGLNNFATSIEHAFNLDGNSGEIAHAFRTYSHSEKEEITG